MGYVYIIKDIEVSGLCKIGHSDHPARRVYEFGVLLPFQTMVVMLIRTNDMLKLERTLHHIFAENRVNGEWFQLSQDEITYIHSMVEYLSALEPFTPAEQSEIWAYCEQKRLDHA